MPDRHPLADNPLVTREEVQRAVIDLIDPLRAYWSSAGARVRLGTAAAIFGRDAEHLEGFARPLWGLVPFALGGGTTDLWDLYVGGLAAGTNPDHPEYWGPVRADGDQRMVEMASIGYALAAVPNLVWEPLDGATRRRVVAWLRGIFEYEPAASNWQLFRIMVGSGLSRVGEPVGDAAMARSFAIVEEFYEGDGWYVDGRDGHHDHYVAFAFHMIGLVYSSLPDADPGRAAEWRRRAAVFATDYQHWFDPTGGALPFGRSLTYRFATAAFWSALVAADLEALPWGRIRALWLRQLRWWRTRSPFDRDGVLSVGYGYPNRVNAEEYNSAGSPYWALTAFLGLAAPADHPVWRSEEEVPDSPAGPFIQRAPGMSLSQDGTQVVALSGRHRAPSLRQGEAKYARFAYSSRFGFSSLLPGIVGRGVADSMLNLVDDDDVLRVKGEVVEHGIHDSIVWSVWEPWPDVRIATSLHGRAPWHLRVHAIESGRPLRTYEAGFAVGWAGIGSEDQTIQEAGDGIGDVETASGRSAVRDLPVSATPVRAGRVFLLAPDANVIEPRALVPVLTARLLPGRHLLACAVWASDRAAPDWDSVDEVGPLVDVASRLV